MSSTTICLIAAGCTCGGALFGIWLQSRLPSHHLKDNSFEIVKLGAGMLATITALVLGLLVSSAKGTFDTINDGIRQVSAKAILLDRVLAQYGPETQPAREQIKQSIAAVLQASLQRKPANVAERPVVHPASRVEAIQSLLCELKPQTAFQRQLFSEANQIAADLAQTRWLMMAEAQNELPLPLLVILICWLTFLFISFGLFSPRNATVVTVLFVSACSMSAAIFLVLELNRPLDGFIKVSSAPLRNVLEQLGR